jgi:hypothetical protein
MKILKKRKATMKVNPIQESSMGINLRPRNFYVVIKDIPMRILNLIFVKMCLVQNLSRQIKSSLVLKLQLSKEKMLMLESSGMRTIYLDAMIISYTLLKKVQI